MESSSVELSTALANASSLMETLINGPSLDEKLSLLESPVDRAEMLITLAYAVHTLSYAVIQIHGDDPKTMPSIPSELERLKIYFDKVDKLRKGKSERRTCTLQLSVYTDDLPATLRVDQAAAKRFIQHAIGKKI